MRQTAAQAFVLTAPAAGKKGPAGYAGRLRRPPAAACVAAAGFPALRGYPGSHAPQSGEAPAGFFNGPRN
jgi:hypothetical protein